MFTVTNPAYLKLLYGKRPDSGSSTVLACDRAAQCTVQEWTVTLVLVLVESTVQEWTVTLVFVLVEKVRATT